MKKVAQPAEKSMVGQVIECVVGILCELESFDYDSVLKCSSTPFICLFYFEDSISFSV